MLKKILSTLLSAALLFATGCAALRAEKENPWGNLDPKHPVTVTLWHYYVGENQQALESAASTFNQTVGVEQGVIVSTEALGSIAELEKNITDSAKGVIRSRPMPQIFSSYPDKAMEIDGYEMVVDLNEYLTEEERALYNPDFLSDGIFEGNRLLLLPIVKSTELLYINETAWSQFTEEQRRSTDSLSTWESLYKTAKAYYEWVDAKTPEEPWDGTALMGFDSLANFIIVGNKQMGVDIIDAAAGDTGMVILNSTVLRRVFDVYCKGMALGYFGAEGKFRSDDIKAGKLIAYVGSSSSAAYFPTWIERNSAQSPINFLALPYPVFEGGDPYAIQQGAGMCVAKSTPAQQEGAVLFLKWFTEAKQNIQFAMTTGYLPVQSAAYDLPEFDDALAALHGGQQNRQNVGQVYTIALRQITEQRTYAAKPFPGSYEVRSILQTTLAASARECKLLADEYKTPDAAASDVLAALDLDGQFARWMTDLKSSLDEAGIPYTEA